MIKYTIKNLARILSHSLFLSTFARLICMYRANDRNHHISKNGELNLIKFLAQSDLFFLSKQSFTKQKKDYFFDVGANVGDYSKFLHYYFINKSAATDREIFAFEPSLDNMKKIKKHKLNNINLINCAVSNKNSKMPFFKNKNRLSSGTDSLFDMNTIGYESKYKKKYVKTITLDDFCLKNKINMIKFLKIDIEGAEFSCLQGSRGLLKKSAIDIIQFEFGHAARANRVYLLDIIRLLKKYNYYTYALKPRKLEKIIYTPFVENRYNMANFVSFQDRLLPVMKSIIGKYEEF